MPFTPPSVDPNLYPDWQTWARQLLKYIQQVADEQASGIGYQLTGHVSTDLPSAATDGTIIYKTDTEYVSAAFSDTWYDFAVTGKTNSFSALQQFTSSASNATVAQLISTNADANGGPFLMLDRQSGSPASNDSIGGLIFRGRDDGLVATDYCTVQAVASDVTNGSEDGYLSFNFFLAGSVTNIASLGPGLVIGNAVTGGFPGNGSINIKTEYRVQGVKVVESRKTGWGAPTGTPTRTAFDTTTVTLPQLAERVKALIDDMTTHGLIGT